MLSELLRRLDEALVGDPNAQGIRKIIVMRYREGLTGKDLAQSVGVSEPRVSQLHAVAMNKLRKFL